MLPGGESGPIAQLRSAQGHSPDQNDHRRDLAGRQQNQEPLDPVARFHLKNGARLERVNWLGDTSASGLQRSVGLTANYVYKLPDVERNHEFYVREHKVRASREIEALAKRFVPPARF